MTDFIPAKTLIHVEAICDFIRTHPPDVGQRLVEMLQLVAHQHRTIIEALARLREINAETPQEKLNILLDALPEDLRPTDPRAARLLLMSASRKISRLATAAASDLLSGSAD